MVQLVVAADLRLEVRTLGPALVDREVRERGEALEVLLVDDGAQVHRELRLEASVDARDDALEGRAAAFEVAASVMHLLAAVEGHLKLTNAAVRQQWNVVCEGVAVGDDREVETPALGLFDHALDEAASRRVWEQRLATEQRHVLSALRERGIDVPEERAHHGLAVSSGGGRVLVLIAVGTAEIAGVGRDVEELDLVVEA